MSKKKTKTSSTSTSSGTVIPQAPGWLQGPAEDYFTQVRNLLNSNSGGTGPSSLQTQGFNTARSIGGGASAIRDAATATRGETGYTPDAVTAGQLSNTDLSPYMNPYTSSVIDAALADLERMRGGAIADNQSAATRARAYGGSRHGVVDTGTNEAAFRTGVATSAGLRSAGFDSARTAALEDIRSRMGADEFNVQSGLEGARTRLSAAGQLGGLGAAEDANARATATTQVGLGEMERDASDPGQQRMQWLRQIAQLLGIDPEAFIGQSMSQTGSSSGSSTTSGGLTFGWSPDSGFSIGYGG